MVSREKFQGTVITNEIQFKRMSTVKPEYPPWLPAQLRRGWKLSCRINRTVSEVLPISEIAKLNAVEGYLSRRQGVVLFYFTYSEASPGRVVEIGSFKGKPTVWMAKALQLSGRDDKVVSIDPHVNTHDDRVPNYDEPNSYDVFLKNVLQLNLTSWVEPIRSTSEAAAKNWNEQIRLLFVDGSHRYEDVLLDLRLWEPWVNIGGIICMDDTKPKGSHPGVLQAVNEYIVNSKRFRELLQLHNLTVFAKVSSS